MSRFRRARLVWREPSSQFLSLIRAYRTAIVYSGILMMSLLGGAVAWAQGPATVLHRFTGYAYATGPRGGLVLASDGHYYGTRAGGGAFQYGSVFRMTPGGVVTTVHEFRGGDQGFSPDSSLTLGPDGALVGTMHIGSGDPWVSAVFRLTRDGSSYEVLHRFDPVGEGYNYDFGRILLGRDGNFYGTLPFDEEDGHGAVYRMTPAGSVTILHRFAGAPADGRHPQALIQASDGGFFGVTETGGPCRDQAAFCRSWDGKGTLFHMTPDGAVTILHGFGDGPADGILPTTVILGANGTLYGTTLLGPCNPYPSCAGGTIFEWTAAQGYRVLAAIEGQPTSIMQTADGTLYGTTLHSVAPDCYRCGAVFKIGTDGRPVYLNSFLDSANGALPHGLIEGSDGALYGTTEHGGTGADAASGGLGTIFRLDRDDAFRPLHRFMGNEEGAYPDSPLVQATDGNFYGTTRYGGIYNSGTVYRMTPRGDVQLLHTFTGGVDGGSPTGLVQAADGFLYGATATNGVANQGTVFRMSLAGAFSIIHAFAAPGPSGDARLVLGANGLLYGVSREAFSGPGTIFHMTLTGAATVIHRFSAGEWPTVAPLLQARDGYLYGTTSSKVFRIGPSGGFTVLHQVNAADTLVQGRDGSIYGVAKCLGRVFRFAPGGGLEFVTATIKGYSYCRDWGEPSIGIAADRRGNILVYGSRWLFSNAFAGQPTANCGRIAAIGLDGTITPIHQSTDCRGGDTPITVMQASDGRLYVTTALGGDIDVFAEPGTILRVTVLPLAPRILFTAAAPAGGLTLTWWDDAGAERYTIVRTGGTAGQAIVASGVVGNTFTDSTVVPGVVYSYVVHALHPDGVSVQSAAVSVPWLTPASRTPTVTTIGDYDGDGKADLTVYRGATGTWFSHRSSNGALATYAWGAPLLQDRPVPADYDGDGVTDVAGYRQTTAEWFIHRSSDGALVQLAWGAPALGDVPVPADYDGDGRADIAGYRTTNGDWLIRRSSDNTLMQAGWGSPLHGDVPVPADYDGDGRADLAGYRTTTGEWLIHQSSDGALVQVGWGSPLHGDVPVPADYDGDGRTDLAGYRATTGEWLIHQSSDGALVQWSWGSPAHGDVPVVGDYDGDGRADVAIYRALTAEWFIIGSAGGVTATQWGAPSLGDAVRFY